MQTWQTFFACAQLLHISTRLRRPFVPACQANTVKGTSQTWHFFPNFSCVIRTYGLSPRQVSQTNGNSESSHFCLLSSFLSFWTDMICRYNFSFLFPLDKKPKASFHLPRNNGIVCYCSFGVWVCLSRFPSVALFSHPFVAIDRNRCFSAQHIRPILAPNFPFHVEIGGVFSNQNSNF